VEIEAVACAMGQEETLRQASSESVGVAMVQQTRQRSARKAGAPRSTRRSQVEWGLPTEMQQLEMTALDAQSAAPVSSFVNRLLHAVDRRASPPILKHHDVGCMKSQC
jgi:hypothetical protein